MSEKKDSTGTKIAKAVVEPVVLAATGQGVGAVITTVAAPFRIAGAIVEGVFGDDDDDDDD